MKKLYFPKNYSAKLNVLETEIAVKKIKDFFQKELSNKLNLTRVSAPLFVFPETGLNDGLNGYERAVKFDVPDIEGKEAEIVHSLAKWKRHALYRYDFKMEEGLYTDMNAIRRDEELDNLHSIYVDQWDWEKIIPKEERKLEKLKKVVCDIYSVFKKTEEMIKACYEDIQIQLPQEIFFISSQELEDMYPDLSPKEREDKICREKKAVFLMGIGEVLNSGEKHDGRAPDYDDWKLNGDILFWNPILGCAFELSSMGIRVDAKSLKEQLAKCGSLERLEREYHSMIMDGMLPYTIGGGIGQSRICMFFLNKAHIGEVQASLWPASMKKECIDRGIELL